MMSSGSFYQTGDGAALVARLSIAANDVEQWQQLLGPLLGFVRSSFAMEVAFISEIDGGRRYFRHINADSTFCPIAVGDSDPLEDSYCARVVDGRLPEHIVDAKQLPLALEIPATEALPVGTHLSVPIRLADGSVYGTFCCFSRDVVLDIGHRDMEFMRVMATLVGRFLSADVLADRQRQQKITSIRQLLEQKSIAVALQPVFLLNRRDNTEISYAPFAAEALARFDGNEGSVEQVFVDAAEVGMSEKLELRCLAGALSLGDEHRKQLLSVNISASVLCSRSCRKLLANRSLDGVIFEITEREEIPSYVDLLQTIDDLKRRGAGIAVDDAGAGHASMRHVLQLKPDWIKLDRSLVEGVDRQPEQQALIRSMVQFAEDTGAVAIAEGVEQQRELECLYQLGVRHVQGYLMQRPQIVSH